MISCRNFQRLQNSRFVSEIVKSLQTSRLKNARVRKKYDCFAVQNFRTSYAVLYRYTVHSFIIHASLLQFSNYQLLVIAAHCGYTLFLLNFAKNQEPYFASIKFRDFCRRRTLVFGEFDTTNEYHLMLATSLFFWSTSAHELRSTFIYISRFSLRNSFFSYIFIRTKITLHF